AAINLYTSEITTSQGISAANIISAAISIYMINISIIWGIYAVHSEGLVKHIKHIKVVYKQDDKTCEGKDIKFEDFDIDKDYFSYLDSKRVRTVIPTKDLLRIEYVYKDN
ncbi:hypothetical protein, partial [Stenotrophomonas maltophilia group sp. RNC7]|uniref:hypothetical protein n=1 Tax=Stenotrophomonas maltophilia group sp. RNC7 TaxID=3071467 RepID=UPI0027E0260A